MVQDMKGPLTALQKVLSVSSRHLTMGSGNIGYGYLPNFRRRTISIVVVQRRVKSITGKRFMEKQAGNSEAPDPIRIGQCLCTLRYRTEQFDGLE
jgi:hypothetical protein